jgi:hypothetical protein
VYFTSYAALFSNESLVSYHFSIVNVLIFVIAVVFNSRIYFTNLFDNVKKLVVFPWKLLCFFK